MNCAAGTENIAMRVKMNRGKVSGGEKFTLNFANCLEEDYHHHSSRFPRVLF